MINRLGMESARLNVNYAVIVDPLSDKGLDYIKVRDHEVV